MGLRLCCCFCPPKNIRKSRSTNRSFERTFDSGRRSVRDKEDSYLSCSSSFPKDYQYNSPCNPARTPDPLTTYNWYYGTISRFQAHELLKNEPDGVFLLRKSSETRTEYPYIISVKQKTNGILESKENYHYRIRRDENGYFTLGSNLYFRTVMDLIEFYKGREDILKVTLRDYIDHSPR